MYHQDYNSGQSLFFLIKRIGKRFMMRLNRNFVQAGHDITSEQWRILKCLQNHDGQRQQDLADIVRKDKANITRIVDGMEKRDLVVRIPDRLDRRQNLVYLTSKGKRLQEELMQVVQQTALEAQREIEPEHLDIVRKVLTKIQSNLSGS